MADEAAEDWMNVASAASLLGLEPKAVYRLIARGELEASQSPATVWKRNGQVGERRFSRVRRQAVMDFIERSRVRPGEMRHLLNPDLTAPEISVAKIRRACREQIPPAFRDEVRLEVTVRGRTVTIWERRPPGHQSAPGWTRVRIAQLRYDPGTGGWLVFTARGRNRWMPYDINGTAMDIDSALSHRPTRQFLRLSVAAGRRGAGAHLRSRPSCPVPGLRAAAPRGCRLRTAPTPTIPPQSR